MTSIGETLRRERLRQGLDLQQLSESTKIGTRMLQAMEVGDFSKLPGGVFTRSFIKQYASALGLDPAAMDAELKALHVEGDEARRGEQRREHASYSLSSLTDRGPEPNSITASLVWVLLALLVCSGVYYLMNRNTGTAAPSTEEKAAAGPEKTPEKKAEAPPVAEVPVAAPAPAQAAPDAPPPAAQGGPIQVVISASEPSWVSITADGKSVFVGVLQPNEKREVSASEKVKLVAGNAGGLDISLNGKTIDSIGPKGQVRVVELTPAGAHVIPRMPPNPAPLL